jgi:hypothetical protein
VIPPEPTGPAVPEAVVLVQRMMGLRGSAIPTVIVRDRVLKSDIDELDPAEKHVVFVATREWMSAARAAASKITWIRIEHFLLLELKQALNQDVWRYHLCTRPPSSKLPGIEQTDAIVRILGLKVGDVLEITRPSGIYYRIVKP